MYFFSLWDEKEHIFTVLVTLEFQHTIGVEKHYTDMPGRTVINAKQCPTAQLYAAAILYNVQYFTHQLLKIDRKMFVLYCYFVKSTKRDDN